MMFTEPLAAKIIKGEKTATRRVMSDKPGSPWFKGGCKYEVGQTFAVNPGRGVLRVADAKIINVYKQRLGEMTNASARAEGFADATAFWKAWAKINGREDGGEMVWVVEFHLSGPTCLGCDGCGWCEGSPAFLCPDCFSTGSFPSDRGRALVAKVAEEEGEASA
jgi:uncharacterized protein YhfF